MNRKVLMPIVFMLLFFFSTSLTQAQASTFIKDLNVNATIKVELTDVNNQTLKTGSLYRITLSITSTGTRTGTEYLVWYDSPTAYCRVRTVSVVGHNSI